MDATTLYLVRGLPGSGKSTLARRLVGRDSGVYEADQFFESEDGYKFDGSKIGEAHAFCQNRVRYYLNSSGGGHIAVANTFTQKWELDPYIELASQHSAQLVIVSIFDGGCSDQLLAMRNKHGVGVGIIEKMRARWQHDIGIIY